MMENRIKIISSVAVTLAICGMLCSNFFTRYNILDNYLQLFPISLGIGLITIIAFFAFLIKRNGFRISAPDILISVLVIYNIARYDYELQLANWKIIFAILLMILWFAVRVLLKNMAVSRNILFGGIVTIGCMIAVWGLLQLYGIQPSNHRLFAITGPFYNPGPYSGYLAMIFPISLSCLLQSSGKTRYLWLLGFALMLCILPAGMSRSAWLALSLSSIWVLSVHLKWITKAKRYIQTHHYKTILYCILTTIIIISSSIFLYQMKPDSANGRLFMWKITCKVIADKPLAGYGPGAFSHAYGEKQSAYFASGDYTEQEERVAGAPEYAFNEYLQLGVEGGIILLIIFLSLVVWGIGKGISNKEYTACSGIISLLLFSLSSYPFQILPFLMMGVLLLAVCVSNSKESKTKSSVVQKIAVSLLLLVLASGNALITYKLRNTNELSQRLYYIKILQNQDLEKEASTGFSRLYPFFKHDFNFLFKYARSLYVQKRYNEAIDILERAKLVSCHPNIYNLQGQYYQAAGDYTNAEKCYKKSALLLPIRIFPYYLLAKLYAEPSFFHEAEMKKMINIVLSKKPKVDSNAIHDMRMEMNILLNNKFNNQLKIEQK